MVHRQCGKSNVDAIDEANNEEHEDERDNSHPQFADRSSLNCSWGNCRSGDYLSPLRATGTLLEMKRHDERTLAGQAAPDQQAVNNLSNRPISEPLASLLPSGGADYGNHVTALTQAKSDPPNRWPDCKLRLVICCLFRSFTREHAEIYEKLTYNSR